MPPPMSSRKTLKYRLYPNRTQEQTLLWVLRRCRELYNAGLQERRDAWKMQRVSIRCYDQINQLPALKDERTEYLQIGSHVLHDVLRRQKPGFPRFKSSQQYDSFTYVRFVEPKPSNIGRTARRAFALTTNCSMLGAIPNPPGDGGKAPPPR